MCIAAATNAQFIFFLHIYKKKKKKGRILVLPKCHTDTYIVLFLASVHLASVVATDAAIYSCHTMGLPNTRRLVLENA